MGVDGSERVRRPKLFSVIVASYNYEDLVIETLESLSAQTFRDFEIVVVDDGSTDGSVANIRKFIERHGAGDVPVRLVTHPGGVNKGLPATVKLGVEEASGVYIAFCEADDLWTDDHLQIVADAIASTKKAAVAIVNDVEIFGDDDRVAKFGRICDLRRNRLRPGVNRIPPADFRSLNYVLTFSAACVRRDVLAACDFSPVGRAAALDWWIWRQVMYDRPLYYIDRKLTQWRMHASLMDSEGAAGGMSEEMRRRHEEFIAAGDALLRRQHPLSAWWRLRPSKSTARPGLAKWLRGRLKRMLPYCVQRAYAYKTYGIYFPDMGPVWGVVPFGVVCVLNGMDPDQGMGVGVVNTVFTRLFAPRYRMSLRRRSRFYADRRRGLAECRDMVARNANARILVALHLFYPEAWPLIQKYLENLSPYRFDLVVSVTAGKCPAKTLDAVKSFAPSVRIIECENRGFDVWPFVRVLNDVDLGAYDIVFKLHSKGVGRPFIFIYDQVFKRSDWFFNLYDGVLGGLVVHRLVDALMNGGAKLAAADNLIVEDPPHKQHFVKAFCEGRGIPYVEDYRYVAGTCFAARAEVFAPLKAMKLDEGDFAPTARGVFSTAHAVERTMCFPAAGALLGFQVKHNTYPRQEASCRAESAMRLFSDPRFLIDDDFFYRRLEMRHVRGYEVVRVRLGEIRRRRNDGSVCRLEECEPFRYLRGDVELYDEYCRDNLIVSGFDMSRERFESLRLRMTAYDPRYMPIISGIDNILMDGQHRCCILLDRYGPDYEIDVLRIW